MWYTSIGRGASRSAAAPTAHSRAESRDDAVVLLAHGDSSCDAAASSNECLCVFVCVLVCSACVWVGAVVGGGSHGAKMNPVVQLVLKTFGLKSLESLSNLDSGLARIGGSCLQLHMS